MSRTSTLHVQTTICSYDGNSTATTSAPTYTHAERGHLRKNSSLKLLEQNKTKTVTHHSFFEEANPTTA